MHWINSDLKMEQTRVYDLSFRCKLPVQILRFTETTLTPEIYLKCKDPSLTLQAYPQFETGEQISGIIEFKTQEYWEVLNGKEKKIRIEGKAYFTTVL